MDNETDQALLERYRNGDRAAFTDLVVRYQRPIYNAAFWVLRRVEDANDITQIVFLKVAEQLDEYDPQYKFFSWIYRIAVNESLNLLRRNRREEALDDEIDLPGSERSQPGMAGWRSRGFQADPEARLMGMTDQRPDGSHLRHFSECSYQEIGQILDLDEKTVKSRLFEARHRLP